MSRIGKKPITIPDNVKINIDQNKIIIEGPKDKLEHNVPDSIRMESKDGKLLLTRTSDSKINKSLHGLTRAIIQNMIVGVTQGYLKELEIVGVGYRAQLQGRILNLQLGFSHPINLPVPEGITIEIPKPTQILVKGADKAKVGEVAAKIRSFYPPEPYKGKGIRYAGEYVRKKAGKAVA